ncbi:MAG: hypothetical protein AVDCRST_MAG85-2306 [uncultured Solirubrobacteraceae bacterium]|uniref:Uncharacterized protein n=1 Tax=uncultured Solirubrobacteraceae bacterium TaxID=1162706 RepID=A0A6J4T0M2_9ACTN|nr:MAG: hypothetical protein AVDCRST_MAG85-2306 [uncultured Solirubrobacteraceae bacterium]
MRDLLRLVPVRVTDVAKEVVLRAGAAQRLDRALGRGERLVGDVGHTADGAGHGVRAGEVGTGVGLATERLDAPLDVLRLRLGLLVVILQTLLERLLRLGQLDLSLQRRLELLLLAVRLVQILDELQLTCGGVCHRLALPSFR